MTESVLPGLERRLRTQLLGDVAFDRFTRGRYATDASHYQIMPLGVVAPRSVKEAEHALASEHLFTRAGDYYTLRGREEIVYIRGRRAGVAARLWPGAVRYGHAFSDATFGRLYVKGFDWEGQHNTAGEPPYDDWRLGQAGFRMDSSLPGGRTLTVIGDAYTARLGQFVRETLLAPPYLRTSSTKTSTGSGSHVMRTTISTSTGSTRASTTVPTSPIRRRRTSTETASATPATSTTTTTAWTTGTTTVRPIRTPSRRTGTTTGPATSAT